MRAAVRFLEAAGARGHGAGERAAHVTEELRLEQRLGDGAAVDRHEPLRAPRAVVMNGVRDELLAGAGFAGDEDRAARLRHRLEQREQLLHRGALADDALELVPLFELLAQVGVLGAQPALLERGVDDVQQLVELERLLDEVARAALDGLDGVLHRAVAGDDDADDVGIDGAGLVEHRGAVGAAAQPEVGDDDVEGERREAVDGLFARGGLLDVEAAVRQLLGDHFAQRRLVFNQQDVSRSHVRQQFDTPRAVRSNIPESNDNCHVRVVALCAFVVSLLTLASAVGCSSSDPADGPGAAGVKAEKLR